ncbi:hypothetical protein [Kiloniella sp.]|uniref:hypothetical protein n=1 Tax=Kiloniella sp. TaxID=1938587 RepID=UPI003A8DABFA
MQITSVLEDLRINASNMLIEMKIKEYEELVKDILQKNEFQRRRVRSSKTVYALLKQDILQQCVIPPVVLALTTNTKHSDLGDDNEFEKKLIEEKDHLVILDGLQRTHTIIDLLNELRSSDNQDDLNKLENIKIRVEVYVGINRLGILYRMLTLNTGQTPMSLRQQIEILYLDYALDGVKGVEFVREADGGMVNNSNQYNFKDIIEGFNAYLDRDALPLDKADILENISSLDKLSKENQGNDLFELFVKSLNNFILTGEDLCNGSEIGQDFVDEFGAPFGKNFLKIFKRPQAVSGFGAASGKLIDFKIFTDLDQLNQEIAKIQVDDPEDFLEEINKSLLWLKNNTNKIGNAQRMFFTFYFRELFNKDSDAYCNLKSSATSALQKYKAQYM